MKAYSISLKSEPDYGESIVWAKNGKEARKQATSIDFVSDAESYIDMRVVRKPEFDDCENMNPFDFSWKQHEEGWLWYDYPDLNEDGITKEEFIKRLKEI